jgi:hypothetical protein
MDLNRLLNHLPIRLVAFPTLSGTKNWIDNNFKSIDFITKQSSNNVISKGNEYIQYHINLITNDLKDELDLMKLSIDSTTNLNLIIKEIDVSKNSLYGAGMGIGAAILLTGPVGWLALAGAALGAGYGVRRKKDEIAELLVNNSKKAANEIYRKLEKEIQKVINNRKLLNSTKILLETSRIETLTEEQKKIKNFLESRDIQYLVHFTDTSNIQSIKHYGLLSINELTKRKIHFKQNDLYRMDGFTDFICLSITNLNKMVYWNFKKTDRIKSTSLVKINASVLYLEINKKRFYCDRNASANSCEKGSTIDFLANMFRDEMTYSTLNNTYIYNRIKNIRANNETTDPQAEIVLEKSIDKKYITEIRTLE